LRSSIDGFLTQYQNCDENIRKRNSTRLNVLDQVDARALLSKQGLRDKTITSARELIDAIPRDDAFYVDEMTKRINWDVEYDIGPFACIFEVLEVEWLLRTSTNPFVLKMLFELNVAEYLQDIDTDRLRNKAISNLRSQQDIYQRLGDENRVGAIAVLITKLEDFDGHMTEQLRLRRRESDRKIFNNVIKGVVTIAGWKVKKPIKMIKAYKAYSRLRTGEKLAHDLNNIRNRQSDDLIRQRREYNIDLNVVEARYNALRSRSDLTLDERNELATLQIRQRDTKVLILSIDLELERRTYQALLRLNMTNGSNGVASRARQEELANAIDALRVLPMQGMRQTTSVAANNSIAIGIPRSVATPDSVSSVVANEATKGVARSAIYNSGG